MKNNKYAIATIVLVLSGCSSNQTFNQESNIEVENNNLTIANIVKQQIAVENHCPDNTARQKYGFCIWQGQDRSFYESAEYCATQGARLCSLEEVSAANAAGGEWCDVGWVSNHEWNGGAMLIGAQYTHRNCPKFGSSTIVRRTRSKDSRNNFYCCK